MLRAPPRPLETHHVSSMVRDVFGAACLGWYCFIVVVCSVGYIQLFRYYSKKPRPATCLTELPTHQIPHVTVIRPVKGLEPRLYECLAATFRQSYPKERLTVYFCVAERRDPAFPILERLLRDFEGFDARVFVEEEDPGLVGDGAEGEGMVELGPNPKIRNMSRAYREAKGDIVWIIDCNVWVGRGVCGRMVDLLCGFGGKRRNKFVHQLPLVIDMDGEGVREADRERLLNGEQVLDGDIASSSSSSSSAKPHTEQSKLKRIWQRGGGRLEEMFMSSSHAKFYTAINTVLIAPCIVGKSNMFRRSHLDYLTTSNPKRAPGIDFFSDNICEDHLIGDALWKKPQAFEVRGKKKAVVNKSNGAVNANGTATPGENERHDKFGKHALLFGDICIQPVSHTSVPSYIARRVRWLRVRKFTVTLATLVEPGTESIIGSLSGAYAFTTLPFFHHKLGIPQTWCAFWMFWATSMVFWCLCDWSQYRLIHAAGSLEIDEFTPDFALPGRRGGAGKRYSPSASMTTDSDATDREPLLKKNRSTTTSESDMQAGSRRTFFQWWCAWLGRELLAFPIWFWAVWGGVSVVWRGRRFWVGVDMKVHEILGEEKGKRVD